MQPSRKDRLAEVTKYLSELNESTQRRLFMFHMSGPKFTYDKLTDEEKRHLRDLSRIAPSFDVEESLRRMPSTATNWLIRKGKEEGYEI